MKKISTAVSLIALLSLLVLPSLTLAQIPPPSGESAQDLPKKPALEIINNVMRWLWTILLVVAVITILIAAYYFVTAAGNPETLGKARGLVLYTVIAIILAAIAWGIVSLVRRVAEGG